MVEMNPLCGATAVWWQDAGDDGVDSECAWPRGHQPAKIHFDEVLGEWDEDELPTNNPNE